MLSKAIDYQKSINEKIKFLDEEKLQEIYRIVEIFYKDFAVQKKGLEKFCGFLSDEDAAKMTQLIAEECERVDYNEW
ncbi:MAG: hypothetical protein ISS28_02300 [Candidatus Cloacimonetes bacterium]|nr:hypothetical protein [Candidatus Cloacimonadota bacterium]MBL7085920.1 hypothetical protein [Candidatus Cloacimonadota bacterium]